MRKLTQIALAASLLCGGGAVAMAASSPVTVRGTITSIGSDTFTMTTYSGQTKHLQFNNKTKFVSVVPAKLKDIKKGDFVGIGGTGANDAPKALEIVIFPNSMRGAGEGHYPWTVSATVAAADRYQSTSSAGGPPVRGTMTNGTVTATSSHESQSSAGGPPVQGTMTNGTVTGSGHAANGTKQLTISYNDGQHIDISVPPDVPTVRLIPATHAVVVHGAKAFVKAVKTGSDKSLDAHFVAVGKNGLMPPN